MENKKCRRRHLVAVLLITQSSLACGTSTFGQLAMLLALVVACGTTEQQVCEERKTHFVLTLCIKLINRCTQNLIWGNILHLYTVFFFFEQKPYVTARSSCPILFPLSLHVTLVQTCIHFQI